MSALGLGTVSPFYRTNVNFVHKLLNVIVQFWVGGLLGKDLLGKKKHLSSKEVCRLHRNTKLGVI